MRSGIVFDLLRKLVKSVKNSEKCKTNFVGFMVENTTTFVILTSSDSGYFNMKNRIVK
jgi:hypothetical protein